LCSVSVYSTGAVVLGQPWSAQRWMSLQGVVAIKAFRTRCCVDGMTSDEGTRRLRPYLVAGRCMGGGVLRGSAYGVDM
jgi:hypothetical protein